MPHHNELMLLVNLFGGSYRGSIDNRKNIAYLNKSSHRDTIVWDFYNGIDENALKNCIGRLKKTGKDDPGTFEHAEGISGCDVHMWRWDDEKKDGFPYTEVRDYKNDELKKYLSLKLVVMAHGNFDCPSFENDAGSQVHASVLSSAPSYTTCSSRFRVVSG